MSTGLKANPDGSAAIQVGGTDVITLTSGGAATFVTSPTTVQAGTAAAPSITFSGDTNTGIYSPGADTIAFTEGGVESMRIDSAGNVGIGTSTPVDSGTYGRVLDIQSSIGAQVILRDSDDTSKYVRYAFEGGAVNAANLTTIGTGTYLVFGTNNTERARIQNTGNFLIGTTTGSYNLTVAGNIQCFGTGVTSSLNFGSLSTNSFAKIEYDDSNGDLNINQTRSYNLKLYTNNTERARIDPSGNLFVGTTNSGIGTARVNAWSDGTNTAINVASTGNGTSAPAIKVYSSVASGATNGIMCQFLNSAAGGVGSITSNGTSTAYNPSSDGRLKENIQLMTDGLSRVMKLKPVTYNWKIDGSSDDGFIAQDLQEIPEFSNRVNPVGERDGEMYYGVDYMRFVSVLTAAIQEQQAMIDELKAKVAALEGA